MAANRVGRRYNHKVHSPNRGPREPGLHLQKRQARVTVKYNRKELQKRLDVEKWIDDRLAELYLGRERAVTRHSSDGIILRRIPSDSSSQSACQWASAVEMRAKLMWNDKRSLDLCISQKATLCTSIIGGQQFLKAKIRPQWEGWEFVLLLMFPSLIPTVRLLQEAEMPEEVNIDDLLDLASDEQRVSKLQANDKLCPRHCDEPCVKATERRSGPDCQRTPLSCCRGGKLGMGNGRSAESAGKEALGVSADEMQGDPTKPSTPSSQPRGRDPLRWVVRDWPSRMGFNLRQKLRASPLFLSEDVPEGWCDQACTSEALRIGIWAPGASFGAERSAEDSHIGEGSKQLGLITADRPLPSVIRQSALENENWACEIVSPCALFCWHTTAAAHGGDLGIQPLKVLPQNLAAGRKCSCLKTSSPNHRGKNLHSAAPSTKSSRHRAPPYLLGTDVTQAPKQTLCVKGDIDPAGGIDLGMFTKALVGGGREGGKDAVSSRRKSRLSVSWLSEASPVSEAVVSDREVTHSGLPASRSQSS
ncbi:PP14A phosphatase, partial [Atractosteus spatula]|nr:PP14A phosphatase [Atractosteus spatula]